MAGRKHLMGTPIDRKKSGVKRYRVCRPADDPNLIIVDLEFDDENKVELALAALKKLWTKVEGTIMFDPKTRILNIVEAREY
jgi:hypothetical protein